MHSGLMTKIIKSLVVLLSPFFDITNARIRIYDVCVAPANVFQVLVMRHRIVITDTILRNDSSEAKRKTVDYTCADTPRGDTAGDYHSFNTFFLHKRGDRRAKED